MLWWLQQRRGCSCKASSSSLIGGSGAGWEGTAILHHGSYIKLGCLQFVFSIVDQAMEDRKLPPTSLLKATLKSPRQTPWCCPLCTPWWTPYLDWVYCVIQGLHIDKMLNDARTTQCRIVVMGLYSGPLCGTGTTLWSIGWRRDYIPVLLYGARTTHWSIVWCRALTLVCCAVQGLHTGSLCDVGPQFSPLSGTRTTHWSNWHWSDGSDAWCLDRCQLH